MTPEEIAEIENRQVQSLNADAPYNPDVWTLEADRKALVAEVKRLTERLKAAEDVCVLYGWSAAHTETDREKATFELWRRWYDLVGTAFLDSSAHPDLSDETIADLARQREETRTRTLAKIRGEDA